MREDAANSLYEVLAQPVSDGFPATTPDTIITKTVETVDNDRATALLTGTALPLS